VLDSRGALSPFEPGDRVGQFRFLTTDRDTKFTAAFDGVFAGNGPRVSKTSAGPRRPNAFAERFTGTLQGEWLDHMLILGERHLCSVLAGYARYCSGHRPRQGLRQTLALRRVEPGYFMALRWSPQGSECSGEGI
jgi:hypothetical protein